MDADVLIVGGGVVGLITAWTALRRGLTVRLFDAGATAPSISWEETRMVRDQHPESCVAPWLRVLAQIGYGEPENRGITHLHGTPEAGAVEHEPEAFVVDTARVRAKLREALGANSVFAMEGETHITATDPETGSIRLADGRMMHGRRIVVAAGMGSAALARTASGPPVRKQAQLCALLTDDAPSFPPTIQHHQGSGIWATPALGPHPAKVSAQDMAFASERAACAALARPEAKAGFVARLRLLSPQITVAHVAAWTLRTYPHRLGTGLYRDGAVAALLACNGGGFKRAPFIAEALLSEM